MRAIGSVALLTVLPGLVHAQANNPSANSTLMAVAGIKVGQDHIK